MDENWNYENLIMEKKVLSRPFLESLSSVDLLSLADDYGIDVPDDLNRRFIIGELLEIAAELQREKEDDIDIVVDAPEVSDKLPESFNETHIDVVLRNPVWAFVYWDIKEVDLARLHDDFAFSSLFLRVAFFADEHSAVPLESFDVQISLANREQYVLLPAGKRFFRIDLMVQFSGRSEESLAISRRVAIPVGSDVLNGAAPGRDVVLPELVELSSMKELLRMHYERHRHSFST